MLRSFTLPIGSSLIGTQPAVDGAMHRAKQTLAVIEMDESTGELITADSARGDRALLLYAKERGRWGLVRAEMWSSDADATEPLPKLASLAR